MPTHFDRIIGLLCITLGIVAVLLAIGDLIMRILLALMGLLIINYGLRLRGMPPLYITIMRMWSTRYDFQ